MLTTAQTSQALGEGVAGKSNMGTNSLLLSTVLLISIFEDIATASAITTLLQISDAISVSSTVYTKTLIFTVWKFSANVDSTTEWLMYVMYHCMNLCLWIYCSNQIFQISQIHLWIHMNIFNQKNEQFATSAKWEHLLAYSVYLHAKLVEK